jgi:hypothetical protein
VNQNLCKGLADRKISGADVFNAPSTFTIDPKVVQDTNEIRIVRASGSGPLYIPRTRSSSAPRNPSRPPATRFS